jgi:hypothetical protein
LASAAALVLPPLLVLVPTQMQMQMPMRTADAGNPVSIKAGEPQ